MVVQVLHRTPIQVTARVEACRGGSVQRWYYEYTVTLEDGSRKTFTGSGTSRLTAENIAIRESGRLIEKGVEVEDGPEMVECPACGKPSAGLVVVDEVAADPNHPMTCPVMCTECANRLALAAEPDREYTARLDAERVTLEFRNHSARRLDAGRLPFEESPLWGGPKQGSLF